MVWLLNRSESSIEYLGTSSMQLIQSGMLWMFGSNMFWSLQLLLFYIPLFNRFFVNPDNMFFCRGLKYIGGFFLVASVTWYFVIVELMIMISRWNHYDGYISQRWCTRWRHVFVWIFSGMVNFI